MLKSLYQHAITIQWRKPFWPDDFIQISPVRPIKPTPKQSLSSFKVILTFKKVKLRSFGLMVFVITFVLQHRQPADIAPIPNGDKAVGIRMFIEGVLIPI
jgi:hypothetical protein